MHNSTDDPSILKELARAEAAFEKGDAAKARVAARRAVGIAITEWIRRSDKRNYPNDAMRQMRLFLSEEKLPLEVHNAVERLQARIDHAFKSPSSDPIHDAIIIINYLFT